jgi:anaerobic selenocysteine-containing dehydrogenase
MGLNQSTHGTWNTNAICNLHLATAAICRPGSGPMSLTGQPNAMGGREMGYMGPGLPGQRSVLSTDDRAFVEDQWGLPAGTIRSDVGPGTIDMFEQLADGRIKACWIICTNPVATVANRKTVITGLENAQFVITQDAYCTTATNNYADVVLPATLWAESDAVMVNSERNLTLLQQSIPPAGQARPDWQLICQVAAHMGFEEHFGYQASEEISTRYAGSGIRRPATTCAAPATSGCGRRRCSGPAHRMTTTGIRSATSTTGSARSCSSTRMAMCRGWRFRPRRGARCFTPGRTWMRVNCPARLFLTSLSCSTRAGYNTNGTR